MQPVLRLGAEVGLAPFFHAEGAKDAAGDEFVAGLDGVDAVGSAAMTPTTPPF